MNQKHHKITLICTICLIECATMRCVEELSIIGNYFERAVNDPYGSGEQAFQEIDDVTGYEHIQVPTPTPTPEFKPVEILSNDIATNNVANKDHYTMIGGSKDVHICGNMADSQTNVSHTGRQRTNS